MNKAPRHENCINYAQCLNQAAYRDESLCCSDCPKYQPAALSRQIEVEIGNGADSCAERYFAHAEQEVKHGL